MWEILSLVLNLLNTNPCLKIGEVGFLAKKMPSPERALNLGMSVRPVRFKWKPHLTHLIYDLSNGLLRYQKAF